MQSSPVNVLLIDDDEDDYIVVRDLLSDISSIQFILKWVSDYEDALGSILSGEFDVCLLDYRLKERNGLELLHEALSRNAVTPIVFLTGHGRYDLDLEAMGRGASDWLDKGKLSSALLERSIRYAIERQRKREELIKAKRVIQALSECNHAVIHIEDEFDLLRAICRIVVDVGGYRMAWVGYAEEDRDQTVTPVAKYGYEKGYLETFKATWQDAETGRWPEGACIRTGFPSVIRSVCNQAEFTPWKMEASKRGYASVIGLPLLLDGRRLGALTIYSSETDAFDSEAVEFLVKLSSNLAYGIGVLRLRKARMQADESLKEANRDLERRVDERTAELIKVNAELTREVVERRQVEDALRLSERSLNRAELVARLGNWAFILGCDNVEASEGARIIYGLKDAEWSIPKIQKISLPEHRGMLDQTLSALIEEGKPYNVEFKIRRPTDGKILDIHSIAEYSPEKRMVFGVIQDITERKQMEKALLASEERLRTLINSTPDIVCFRDGEGHWLEANDAELELFDLKGASYKGKKAAELAEFSEFYREALLDCETTDELAFQKHAPVRGEEIIPRPDGTTMVYDVIKAPLFHPDGRRKGLVVLGRDITERKWAEEALRDSETRLRVITDSARDAILMMDPDGVITFWNPAAERILGHTREEACGQNLHGLIAPQYYDAAYHGAFPKFVETGRGGAIGKTLELVARRKDGEEIPVELSLSAVFMNGWHAVGLLRDITERKRAEIELRTSEESFSRFFRASPVGTSITRFSDYQYVDVNDAWLGLFGYTREEVIGRNPLDLKIWAVPGDSVKMVEILRRQGRVKDFETRFRLKSGELADVLFSGEVIEAAGHRYILGLAYDITDLKRAEKERKKLEEQLFQAQKMESVGRLAGGVAHDFNNMLGVIIGRAEMALNKDVSADKLQHNLEEILNAGLRSADLTRQLLAFARKQTAVPKILDLNDTISGLLKMLRRLIGEDVDLFWAPGLDLWKVKIDPSQVDQILANLVVNARDAISEVGAITMRTENVVIDDSDRAEPPDFIPGQYVLLTVRDTGEGMTKEVREKIFEPFFTTKEMGKGTGLGLSTVYGIVKQNEGFIYVACEPGKGTTFKIYLPRFYAETAQIVPEEMAAKPPTGTETILLVEDDEAILDLGKIILEMRGYTVLAAQAPEQAIHLVQDHPGDIHLLITDVVMPGMNGRELAERLGAIRPNLKCLYMSGYTADVIAHRGIMDEGLNFIQKPFGSEDLAERVRQVLDHLE